MSGLAGLWNLDGAPMDGEILRSMSGTLRHRGPDGEGCRHVGSFGLACQHMWVTPEEQGELQPLTGRRGALLALDGRLDNRDELLAALKLPRTASDAACALAAYEAWDEAFAAHLNGDFALAVFDEPKQQLLLVRDSIGIRPLYYFHDRRLFAFASEIKALLIHPGIEVRPDDEGLADFMLVGSRPVDRCDATCFAGVSALPPAHLTVVTRERQVLRRYWDFDTGRKLNLRSPGEYAEAFGGHFAQAVRRRLRSVHPVAVSVSGGLDSSSIFCQAQLLRREEAASCPEIAGISYVGAKGSDADEERYLIEIERHLNVRIERFPIDPVTGVASRVADQVRAIEAPFLDHLWNLTCELYRRTAVRGSRVLLSGHWGDQVLFSSAYLVDLFKQLGWGEIRRHQQEYKQWMGEAEARVLARRFATDVARHHLPRNVLRPLKWAKLRLSKRPAAKLSFSDAFLERARRFADRPAVMGHGFHSAQARALYLEARSKYHVHCMEWNNKAAASFGLDAAFPFLDRELLAFLMATPGNMQNPDGVPRGLLREAMRGVLPEAVRLRRGKADFTVQVNAGVAQDATEIAHRLTPGSLGVRHGYFDGDRLGAEVTKLRAGLGDADCVKSWDLTDLFGLEVWLQVFLAEQSEESR
jgi:asparagine synthase (glutamine-hydrolysing)